MNRALIEAIIHGANLATADAFPGHKHALKENALNVFKLMMDDARVERCACGAPLPPNSQECDRCAMRKHPALYDGDAWREHMNAALFERRE